MRTIFNLIGIQHRWQTGIRSIPNYVQIGSWSGWAHPGPIKTENESFTRTVITSDFFSIGVLRASPSQAYLIETHLNLLNFCLKLITFDTQISRKIIEFLSKLDYRNHNKICIKLNNWTSLRWLSKYVVLIFNSVSLWIKLLAKWMSQSWESQTLEADGRSRGNAIDKEKGIDGEKEAIRGWLAKDEELWKVRRRLESGSYRSVRKLVVRRRFSIRSFSAGEHSKPGKKDECSELSPGPRRSFFTILSSPSSPTPYLTPEYLLHAMRRIRGLRTWEYNVPRGNLADAFFFTNIVSSGRNIYGIENCLYKKRNSLRSKKKSFSWWKVDFFVPQQFEH